jgi:hypothetical protein
MVTAKVQRLWCVKYRYVKMQLNFMAPNLLHNDLRISRTALA